MLSYWTSGTRTNILFRYMGHFHWGDKILEGRESLIPRGEGWGEAGPWRTSGVFVEVELVMWRVSGWSDDQDSFSQLRSSDLVSLEEGQEPWLSVCLSVCLPVCLSACQCVCLYVCLPLNLKAKIARRVTMNESLRKSRIVGHILSFLLCDDLSCYKSLSDHRHRRVIVQTGCSYDLVIPEGKRDKKS